MTTRTFRIAASGLVAASGVLMLLSAAVGFRSELGYLAFQGSMFLLVAGLGLLLWTNRRRDDGAHRPGLKWHAIMWGAIIGEFGLGMMVLGEKVFGASVICVSVLVAGAGWRIFPRSQRA